MKRGFPFGEMADSLGLWWEGFVHVAGNGERMDIFGIVVRHVEEI